MGTEQPYTTKYCEFPVWLPTASHNTPVEDSSAFYFFGRLQRLGTGSRLPQRESRSCSVSLLVSRAAWSYPGVLGSLGRLTRKPDK